MISPVSFSSSAYNNFNELVGQKQKFSKPFETASASTPIKNKKTKKGSLAKKLAIAAGTVAGAMTLLAVGSGKGWFAVKEGGNKFLNFIKPFCEIPGSFIKDKFDEVSGFFLKVLAGNK